MQARPEALLSDSPTGWGRKSGRPGATMADPSQFDELPMPWLRAKHGTKWHRPGPVVIPAWVADMDFPPAPVIVEAITGILARGDLGYPDWPDNPLALPFSERMASRYGWSPDPARVRATTDVVQGLQIVLTLASRPGDGVVLFTPSYPPFLASIGEMHRRLVPAPLSIDASGHWSWDREALERELDRHPARILVLVNPHNPTGKVFDPAELAWIADLAARHELTIVCDEIHAELIHQPHQHTPISSLGQAVEARTVTLTSATKAFNIAGLRAAVVHVGSKAVQDAWDTQPSALFGAVSVAGVEATLAAWRGGQPWLDAVTAHLTRQRDHLMSRLPELGGVSAVAPQAGYLAWLDFSQAGLPAPPGAWCRRHALVELNEGGDFGPGNETHARLNFATGRNVLDALVSAIGDALGKHRDSSV